MARKKTTKKQADRGRNTEQMPAESDYILTGYDDEGRPQWESDGGEEHNDVPAVMAEGLHEAERALAEKEGAASVPLRMHPVVAAIVEADRDRYVPMDDYDDERPRCESLPVKLTEEELHALGDDISELVEKLRRTEEDNKQIRKQLGQAEAMLKGEIHGKNAVKRDGKEMRKVPVQAVGNLKSNRREVYRLDTGERVDSLSRALSYTEIQELSQMPLPGIPSKRTGVS